MLNSIFEFHCNFNYLMNFQNIINIKIVVKLRKIFIGKRCMNYIMVCNNNTLNELLRVVLVDVLLL